MLVRRRRAHPQVRSELPARDSDGSRAAPPAPDKSPTKDDLLDNITLYWLTNTATSSARIYYENRVAPGNAARVQVPTACALFPKEITVPARRWVEARYNLVQWTDMPRGGHFAAMEEPELLVDDVRKFFRLVR